MAQYRLGQPQLAQTTLANLPDAAMIRGHSDDEDEVCLRAAKELIEGRTTSPQPQVRGEKNKRLLRGLRSLGKLWIVMKTFSLPA